MLIYAHPMSRPSLARLAWIFVRYANFTFGGGTATTVVIDREIVERHQLVSPDTARLSYALARLTPGTNVLAYCTGIGWKTRGLPGAVVALIGSSVPCSLFAVLVTVLYEVLVKKPAVAVAMHGAIAAAIAVMFATGWTIIRPLRREVKTAQIVLFSLAAFALSMIGVSPIQVLVGAALVGCLLPQKGAER
jgi:chromate transporter